MGHSPRTLLIVCATSRAHSMPSKPLTAHSARRSPETSYRRALHGACTRSPAWVLRACRPATAHASCKGQGECTPARSAALAFASTTAPALAPLSLPASSSLPLPPIPRAEENLSGTSPPRGLLYLAVNFELPVNFQPGAAGHHAPSPHRGTQPFYAIDCMFGCRLASPRPPPPPSLVTQILSLCDSGLCRDASPMHRRRRRRRGVSSALPNSVEK